MSKSSRVLPRRAKEVAKTEAVQAVADSTQERRKSTRLRKRKAPEADSSDDSNQVSGSQMRRKVKTSRQGVGSNKSVPKQRRPVWKMGRQIPLTFTARGKTLCKVVTQAESSNVSPSKTTMAAEDGVHSEDNNVLMREWLELKANKGDLHGLQWHDKSRKLVRISWKHGSKSGWTADDSQVFISWACCTGRYDPNDKRGFKRWKANFRCALNSLQDVKQVPEECGMKTSDPYKVYRLLSPVTHRRVYELNVGQGFDERDDIRAKRFASDPTPFTHHSFGPLVAPVTTPRLSVNSSHPAVLPSFAAFLPSTFSISAPANPASPTFAGWLTSDGGPMTPATSLEQLSGNYAAILLDDHSYADHMPPETQTTTITCNTPIPMMVERLNGKSSDEDEDSDADSNNVNCSVHSTTVIRSSQSRSHK